MGATWAALAACGMFLMDGPTPPRVLDPELVVERIAAAPDIVTPVGIAVDAAGRVLVIESHTHFRPENYDGPPADRILEFVDRDGDGRFESRRVAFEGTRHTMALAVEPGGSLLVATRRAVFRLRRDADGNVTGREELSTLDTPGDYPHNGLSGFALEPDGSILFGLGENLGEPYTLRAADGSNWKGEGEGGLVFRMNRDGSRLAPVATGFWNPFGMTLDQEGRLFAVDNDPDSRPPCRLLHVVAGGDYGFRFRNGRRGLHPFTSWDGEIPGTLPMAAGTGEAPSGVIAPAVDRRGLPPSYAGVLLVTSWGDHAIERYDLEPAGVSVRGRRSIVVQGGERFRPVGIAQGPDGSLFVSDWVDRSYTLHGQGAIWRIRAGKTKAGAATPAAPVDAREPGRCPRVAEVARLLRLDAPGDPPQKLAELLRRLRDPDAWPEVRAALGDPDPFLRHAARLAVGGSLAGDDRLEELFREGEPIARREAFLLLRNRGENPAQERALRAGLVDPDPLVRLLAVQWVVESRLTTFEEELRKGIAAGPITDRLFAAYLLALSRGEEGNGLRADERPDPARCAAIAADPSLPTALRARALRAAAADPSAAGIAPDRLRGWLESEDHDLHRVAVGFLARRATTDDLKTLAAIAADRGEEPELRAEAAGALGAAPAAHRALLVELAGGGPEAVRRQAVRGLRDLDLTDSERDAIRRGGADDLLTRPTDAPDEAARRRLLEPGGDPEEGARVFFHPQGPKCASCHVVAGRGEAVGPDLTGFAATATPERLLDSILEPGREVAPQYTVWRVDRADGTFLDGMLLADRDDAQVYRDPTGATITVPTKDVESRNPLTTSLMPADLHRTMTERELRDVLAFLRASAAGGGEKSARNGP